MGPPIQSLVVGAALRFRLPLLRVPRLCFWACSRCAIPDLMIVPSGARSGPSPGSCPPYGCLRPVPRPSLMARRHAGASAPVAWLREARTAKLGFSSFAWSSFPGAGQLQPAFGKSSLGRVSDAMHAAPTDPVATRTTPVSFFSGGLPIFSFRPRPKQFAGGRCYWSRRQREQPLCRIEP
jgi:hypothetical protein